MTSELRALSKYSLYYVVLAGNGGRAIFVDDQDRDAFTSLVVRFAARCHAQIHAYCWTPTDARMLIEVRAEHLPSLMARIGNQHATLINQKLGRKGDRVFNGRYRSAQIVEDEDLLDVTQHIHRTPIDLGLVDDLTNYRGSSHPAYLGQAIMPWVVTRLVMSVLRRKDPATAAYQSWMNSVPVLAPVQAAEHTGPQAKPIGDALFLDSLLQRAQRRSIRFSIEEVTVAVLRWVQDSSTDREIAKGSEGLRLARAMIADYVKANRIATLDAASVQLGRSASALSEAIMHFKTLYPALFGMTLKQLLNGPAETSPTHLQNPELAVMGSGHGAVRAKSFFGGYPTRDGPLSCPLYTWFLARDLKGTGGTPDLSPAPDIS